ncbi:DNA starvation/stationary phase protection protein [uncultured Jannaschia sp.]|uniref:Dps family protein n=1 Tax=uncultured Jannaschia sp. TaxID=293347 RepID=UPI0026331C5F|nr:DNA starvation/stationary phase protection protein [uncultured Jannaschia sp.]
MRITTPIVCLCLAMPLPALAQDGSDTTDNVPLAEEIRETSTTALQDTLYDLIAMKHAAHQEHWNVVGIEYYQMHEFFGELYTDLGPFIDMVAERKRALDVIADGRPSAVSENASIAEPEPAETQGADAVDVLMENWSTVSYLMYERIEATGDDLVTQDLLIAVTALIDKQLWQLRAHTK